MGNSRAMRRRMRPRNTGSRFPERPPALGTVRRWVKQAEAEGLVERTGVDHTGKPGRPAHLYQVTAEGKERAQSAPSARDQLTELQAKRAHALMKKGMSERRAIAAVTKGWRRPQ